MSSLFLLGVVHLLGIVDKLLFFGADTLELPLNLGVGGDVVMVPKKRSKIKK